MADQRAGTMGAYNSEFLDVRPQRFVVYRCAPDCWASVCCMFSTHPPLSERIAVLRNMTVTR